MTRRQRDHRIPAPEARPLLPRIAWASIIFWIVALPLVVSPHGKETFRVPKDLLFIGEGVVLAGLALIAAINMRSAASPRAISRHPVVLVGGAAVIWTAMTALTSTHRSLSAGALLWMTAAVVIGVAVTGFASNRKISALNWALIPAIANAIIFLLQRFRIWSPIQFDPATPEHLRYTALIGNPDDVGSFLVAPMIITLALAVHDRQRRAVWIPIAVVLAAALLTGQITPLIATVAGAILLAFVCSRRTGILAVAALALLIPTFVFAYKPLRERVSQIVTSARGGDFSQATSGRVTPFSAALLMWRDHPVFGVGPDCFAWQYFPYKVMAERRNPTLVTAWVHPFNFAEVHNDHLQTLAETGIVGYALFLAGLFVLGRQSWRSTTNEPQTSERALARIACFPLAGSLFVLCLAHFPLHLAAATSMYLYIGLLCFGWSVPLGLTGAPARTTTLGRIARVALSALVLAAMVWTLHAECYEPYVCNRRKREMETATMRTLGIADGMVAAQRARRTIEMLSDCGSRLPDDVDYYMLAAANYRILGSPGQAESVYEQALHYDRRPELYFNIGSVQLDQGKTGEAVTNFVNAVTFNRDMITDVPPAVRPAVIAILNRDFPYLGIAAQ